MNIQNTVFYNPGGHRLNNILAWSRLAWLTAEDVDGLFEFFADFPLTPDGDIPANTVGLFKIGVGRFVDNNENWIHVNDHNNQQTLSHILGAGAIWFNYTESQMAPVNGFVFTKRVIRRRALHPNCHLVHYLRVPQ